MITEVDKFSKVDKFIVFEHFSNNPLIQTNDLSLSGVIAIPIDSVGHPRKIISSNYSGESLILQLFPAIIIDFFKKTFGVSNQFEAHEFLNKMGMGTDQFINWGSALTIMLFFMLLHCKNITVTKNHFDLKLIKHQKKNNKPYFEKYYTLAIKPMTKILNEEGSINTQGLNRALHICRGHFKTFTSEHLLFGKHEGTYWWESQIRGNEKIGTIVKDYKIKTS